MTGYIWPATVQFKGTGTFFFFPSEEAALGTGTYQLNYLPSPRLHISLTLPKTTLGRFWPAAHRPSPFSFPPALNPHGNVGQHMAKAPVPAGNLPTSHSLSKHPTQTFHRRGGHIWSTEPKDIELQDGGGGSTLIDPESHYSSRAQHLPPSQFRKFRMRYEVSKLGKKVVLPALSLTIEPTFTSHTTVATLHYYLAKNTIKWEGTASPLDLAKTPPPGST